MVIYENYGNGLIKAYSDAGFYIYGGYPEGEYDEAIDPADQGRTYTETDKKIPEPVPTIEEKAEAYDVLMGDNNDD